ncbi:MAG: glycosyltransferase family 2 protein [Desulfurococcaceae archaeon]|nr:glycosyltransferase family 2 protein [Desulfurococcaceae archaeon]
MSLLNVIFLALFSPLVVVLSLHILFLASSRGARPVVLEPGAGGGTPKTITIAIPIKSEPLGLVVSSVLYLDKVLRGTEVDARVLIVSDDGEDYVSRLQQAIQSLSINIPVRVVRRGGSGGRVAALNYALKLVERDFLIILDVDARPARDFLYRLSKCIEDADVCVSHWVGYWTRPTRIARALALSTDLVATALYGGRQRLGLLIFPLGSGTLFRVSSLRAIGGWEDGVLQDDVIVGLKLHGRGFRVLYDDGAILRVLVPSSYRALRIQQLKWAYGSVESLRYSFRYLKDVGFFKSLEARLYTLQYIPALSTLAASITTPLLALVLGVDLSPFSILPVVAVASVYSYVAARTVSSRGLSLSGALKTLGTSSATGLAVAPVVVKGVLLGILGARLKAPVTPKGGGDVERFSEYLEEYTTTLVTLCLALLALLRGYYLAALTGLTYPVALLYTLLRGTKCVREVSHHDGEGVAT